MHSLWRRKMLSRAMTFLTSASAAIVILALVVILSYIAVTGVRELTF